MKRIAIIFSFLILLSVFYTETLYAQTTDDLNPDKIINVEIIPATPGSNQDVSINIESFSYNLNSSNISWYLNDKLVDSGVGKTTFNFKTGNAGTVSSVIYRIKTINGVSFEKKISISPGDVLLLWESLAYTPPFFKGKSLFSFEGQARIIAIANLLKQDGTKYKSDELVYTWKRGMGIDTGASGYGKNVFYWNGDVVSNRQEIGVVVSNRENTTKAKTSILIEPKETEIIAYENNPSLGILFNKATLGTFDLSGSEASFVAEPFYFNNPNKGTIYSWFVNGKKTPESTKYVTFRDTSGDEGYSKIDLDLSGQEKIMQSANSSFTINLSGGKSNNSVTNIFKSFFGQ